MVTVTRRRIHFAAVLLVAAVIAGLLSQLVLGGSDKVEIGNGSVSALARAAHTTDALPQSVLSYPFAARNFASANGNGSRLLQVQGTLRLYGVPGKEGMFVFRLKMPANYKIAPHTHPTGYTVTVLSGTPSVGLGDKVNTKAAHALKAGSFHYLPAKTNHYWLVKGPTEIEVQGMGPFSIAYANPDDNPEKMAAKK